MSQGQPKREEQEPIKYGDVFNVQGDLAEKPIAPQDAAMMQTAETAVLGQTQKGGSAAAMQAAATRNERAGVVSHNAISDIAGGEGVTVTETDVPGRRIITEAVGGQVLSLLNSVCVCVYRILMVVHFVVRLLDSLLRQRQCSRVQQPAPLP